METLVPHSDDAVRDAYYVKAKDMENCMAPINIQEAGDVNAKFACKLNK